MKKLPEKLNQLNLPAAFLCDKIFLLIKYISHFIE